MFVFVLDKNKKPLEPCHPARARKFLKTGKAKVFKRFPLTIIMVAQELRDNSSNHYQLKIDPGSKTTGLAILRNNQVIWGAGLSHRGSQIKDALLSRRQLRRSRRNRKTRYRKPRFLNRSRPKGWLAPSLMSRVHNIVTWVNRLIRVCPILGISQELVKFDLQKLENPEISGIEYQQGELFGYEVREYLLEKWGRKCTYCDKENVPLQIEHIVPKSKGGSNRITNLCLACPKCNQKKGNKDIEQFLSRKPDLLKKVLTQAKKPLKDATAVNSTRWALFDRLKEFGLPIEIASGGKTKYNRCRLNLPKSHWIDAACVGEVVDLKVIINQPLLIKATGHGTRQMCRTDKYGFPNRYVPRDKFVKGFQTGDIVKAVVTKGKKIGTYIGRIAVRSTGSFNIATAKGLVQGINYKYCQAIHKKDGYNYGF